MVVFAFILSSTFRYLWTVNTHPAKIITLLLDLAMSYTAEWTSILSSDCDIVISPTEELSLQTDLITFLATAQRFQIPILPTTWETGRSEAGLGGTSIIHGSDVDLVTLFAYKRVHETSKRTTTENQLFGLLVREITISGHNFIRQNPHITQLQGICWDISADDKPWPVLIFERSDLRDLYSYYDRKPSWQETDLPARIRYCVEIGTAIIAMHSICTVHGDIKPENVLLFMQKDKPNITKVIDFGYSLQFTPRSRKMKLPISRPWNAPEHTRGMREWTFEQAVKTEVFSYGMLCLWMLFYDYFYKLCPGKGSRYGISTVKESLRPLSRLLLADEPSLTSDQRQSLGNFFDASLQEDPQQRESSIVRLLQNLDPQWYVR
ncbi:serine/threonine protein kinase japonica group [Daldinia bambusicola]|nr:serine/threonine protein kinase japonica group [Daldinia bambusicola]